MMNRQINFRAWNPSSKRMLHVQEFELYYDFDNGLNAGEFENDGDYTGFVIMQSTGVFDKNGIEIYEGDILKDGKGENGTVIYAAPQFCVQVGDVVFSLAEGKINVKRLEYTEIVGNIFEQLKNQ